MTNYWSVSVPIISNNGLTKEVYSFNVEKRNLSYVGRVVYNCIPDHGNVIEYMLYELSNEEMGLK